MKPIIVALLLSLGMVAQAQAVDPLIGATAPEVNCAGLIVHEVPTPYYKEIPMPYELQVILFDACDENGVPYDIALAVIETESQFDPNAVNPYSGCYGYCQLHPACFPSGLSPADNIRYGIAYLGRQIRVYGTEAAGLTAYTVGHDDGSRGYASVVMSRAAKWSEVVS